MSIQWLIQMAWRDSRGQRRLLLLFTLSVVMGIGAIVAIQSLRDNLSHIVEIQARSLLGADLSVSTRRAFTPELESFLQTFPGDRADEVRFRSMAYFPAAEQSRFIQVRALEGAYPFYGTIETQPASVNWRDGPDRGALVEESLMLQLNLQPGDTVRLGETDFEIAGALIRVAGESEVAGFFSPRIYIPLPMVQATGLVQQGSVAQWQAYFRFDDGLTDEMKQQLDDVKPTLMVDAGAKYETVADRRRGVERVLRNLFDFLNLVGFIALLLGGIGVGGAVHVFLQGKIKTFALLRCLGARAADAFRIYLIQVCVVGWLGAMIGTAIGVWVQFLLPKLLAGFLPFEVEIFLSWRGILSGLGFGWAITFLFACFPLLSIRKISPLRALRASIETPHTLRKDPYFWLAASSLGLLVLGFCLWQTHRWQHGLAFFAGLGVSLLILSAIALAMRALLRRLTYASSPYVWRLGLSNLYRPNNRTLMLMVTLGMGVLLIHTLFLTRSSLLRQISVGNTENAPNVILLDVQQDQLGDLKQWLEDSSWPVRDVLPIVTMRVSHLKDVPLSEYRKVHRSGVSGWIYTWEFRNTYRGHVLDNAEVTAGTFVPAYDGPEPYPISITENVAEDMADITVGETITWDVQGIPIQTVVSSIRSVRWEPGKQNFNVVFPIGTIEEAPTVYAVTIKVDGRRQAADLQNTLTQQFPNISLIDLSLVFETVTTILDRAGFVVQFMAAFTVLTGLFVLASAVLTSRYQRIQESVLLRTLGASGSFIRKLLLIEFSILGGLAGLSGILLSIAASWAIVTQIFDLKFQLDWPGLVISWCGVLILTVATGLLTSRGIASHPPLAILRDEG